MKKHTSKETKAKIAELKNKVTTYEELITELFDILLDTPVSEINVIEEAIKKHIDKQKQLEGKLLKIMIDEA